VGATLDLHQARLDFEALYSRRRERKNLYRYFVETRMPSIELPSRPYHTTNDPVMTPALIDHFFNQRTRVFDELDLRRKLLLHSIYDLPEYREVLPSLPCGRPTGIEMRRHQRYSLKCPARLRLDGWSAFGVVDLEVIDVSRSGFQAIASRPLPLNMPGRATVDLGPQSRSTLQVAAVRGARPGDSRVYGFRIDTADDAWRICVAALEGGHTHRDLQPSEATTALPGLMPA
jgi:hypothetical protein